jgi:hypothetical protein
VGRRPFVNKSDRHSTIHSMPIRFADNL